MRKQVELLEHHSDFRPNRANVLGFVRQLDAINNDFARGMFFEPVDASDKCGLA